MNRYALTLNFLRPWQSAAVCVVALILAIATPAIASDLNVLSDSELPSGQDATINPTAIWSIAASEKGGFLLAGTQDYSRTWMEHISDDMRRDWSIVIDQGWPAYGARALVDSKDGGYWAAGYGRSKDTRVAARKALSQWFSVENAATFDYVARLDAHGKLLWQKPIFEGHSHDLSCVQETTDGLVILGYQTVFYRNTAGGPKKTPFGVPWIAKLDKQGNPLWERNLVDQTEPVLVSPSQFASQPGCENLQITADGKITIAATVNEIESTSQDRDGVVVPDYAFQHTKAPGTLVVQLDHTGKQLSRFETQQADSAFLFAHTDGYFLVEHRRRGFGSFAQFVARFIPYVLSILRKEYTEGAGVRITRLSSTLQVLGAQEILNPAFSERLTAVLATNTGTVFVAGCDLASVNSIAEISSTGSLTAIRPIFKSSTANQCAKVGLARGQPRDLLVFFGSGLTGNRLLRLDTP